MLDLWGCGKGPLTLTTPITRFFTWLSTLIAALLLRPSNGMDLVFQLSLLFIWNWAVGIPFRLLIKLFFISTLLFLPVILFIPFSGHSKEWVVLCGFLPIRSDAWIAPLNLMVRAAICFAMGFGLVASMKEIEFQQTLKRLPLPISFVAVIHNILRWMSPLIEESIGIGRTISLRSGKSCFKTGLKQIKALPIIWLHRVFVRAQHVSNAMAVRNYDFNLFVPQKEKMTIYDIVVLFFSSLLLVAIIGLTCIR